MTKLTSLLDLKFSSENFDPDKESYEIKMSCLNAIYRIAFYSQILKNFEESIKFYKQFLDKSEELKINIPFLDVSVHYNLGMTYFEMKNYLLAIKEFEFTVQDAEKAYGKTSSEYETYYRRLAEAYLTIQQPNKALEIYEELIQLAENCKDSEKKEKIISKYNEFIDFSKNMIYHKKDVDFIIN